MKRTLSLFVTGLVGLTGSMATADKLPVEVQKSALKEVQEMAIMPVKEDLSTARLIDASIAVRSNDGIEQSKVVNATVRSVATKAPVVKTVSATLPAGIVGDKVFSALEYFDNENLVWEGSITADATDETKIWVSDLFFKGELEKPVQIYGIVNAAQKTVSFPGGQILAYTQAGSPIVLCGSGASGLLGTGKNIVGTYDVNGSISFSDYVGANVGEVNNGWYTMYVGLNIADKSKIKPIGFYSAPQGMLYQGWLTTWNSFYSTYAFSPINTNNVFTNTSPTPTATFEWTIEKVVGADANRQDILETSKSTASSITITGKPSDYRMPTLKASNNGVDSVYIMGAPANKAYPAYYSLGGASYSDYEEVDGKVVQTAISGLTSANPAHDGAYYRIGDPDINGATPYLYGTGISANGAQESVIARYQKPLSTLYFEGVDFFLGSFSAPAQTPFTCYIVRIQDNGDKFTRLDTIASSTIYTENVTMLGQGALATMSFTEFTTLTDLGLPAQVNYLELEDPFIVELTGFKVPNCVLAVMSEEFSKPDSKNKAYFVINGVAKQYQSTRAMLVNLRNGAYSYLIPEVEDTKIQLDNQGSTLSRKFFPFFNGMWIENDYDIPEWLTVAVDEDMNTSDYSLMIHVSADPLPAGVEGRTFDLQVKTWGASVNVPVVQGVAAGVSTVEAQATKAVVNGDCIELTYQNMESVSIVDVNGKVYGTYPLSKSGKSVIPAAELSQGVYMLQFKGAKPTIIKLIK